MPAETSDAIQVYGARSIHAHIQAMRVEVEGVLRHEDIEHVHRMRVASRRLRSSLTVFRHCFRRKQYKAFQSDIRAVTRALGEARDLDVQLALLDNVRLEYSTPRLLPGIRRLQLRRKQRRVLAQDNVGQAVHKLNSDRTLETLAAWSEDHRLREDVYLYSPALYQLGFDNIKAHLEALLRHEQYITDPGNVTELHAMRISAKHLRYTLEIFDELYASKLKPYINQVRKLQDSLGEIHDADVWVESIPRFVEEERTRIVDYFGNPRPLKRLLPGLNAFRASRQALRQVEYESFLKDWAKITRDQVWGKLLKLANTPLDIEAAVEVLDRLEQTLPVEDAAPADPKDQSG